jgi:hypothetical protein
LKKTLVLGPLGVLPVSLTAATTIVEEDVDGGPLGVLPVSPAVATTIVEENIDGRPLWGVAGGSGRSHHHSRRRR